MTRQTEDKKTKKLDQKNLKTRTRGRQATERCRSAIDAIRRVISRVSVRTASREAAVATAAGVEAAVAATEEVVEVAVSLKV